MPALSLPSVDRVIPGSPSIVSMKHAHNHIQLRQGLWCEPVPPLLHEPLAVQITTLYAGRNCGHEVVIRDEMSKGCALFSSFWFSSSLHWSPCLAPPCCAPRHLPSGPRHPSRHQPLLVVLRGHWIFELESSLVTVNIRASLTWSETQR